MFRFLIVIGIAGLLALLASASEQAEGPPSTGENSVRIGIVHAHVAEDKFELRYEINNASVHDVWILDGSSSGGPYAEVFVDEDGRTLLVRRRFDVPFSGGGYLRPYARCVLLRSGESRTESIALSLPVRPRVAFTPARFLGDIDVAKRLVVEIGYYEDDLPARMRRIARQADEDARPPETRDEVFRGSFFKGTAYFNNMLSLELRDRDEETLVPYTYQWLKGEQVLRTSAEDLTIPYANELHGASAKYELELPPCTRIEIQYHPSMLEYFFPYRSQQALLSKTERQRLESKRATVLDSRETVEAFVKYLTGAFGDDLAVCELTRADVICYQGADPVALFPIYNDRAIVLDDDAFSYGWQSMIPRRLIPEIHPLELRVECARNLKNLGSWLDVYRRIEPFGNAYPPSRTWCTIVGGYDGMRVESTAPARDSFQCPSAGEGKCHYAMNPHCGPNSPGDTVLLFETKAGWNQYGGPELFTFDNHDPQGGCVLLNDGTVKFIRTKEELAQLRWKP